MTRRSTRLDTLVAILALASPFALSALVVGWTAPAVVATCAPSATSSVEGCERPTPTPIAIVAPTATAEPTPTRDAIPTARPRATATPTAVAGPTSTPEPTQRPSVTQPPTATVAGPVDPDIEYSLSAGFLLIGGLATVVLAIGRRRTDRWKPRPE